MLLFLVPFILSSSVNMATLNCTDIGRCVVCHADGIIIELAAIWRSLSQPA